MSTEATDANVWPDPPSRFSAGLYFQSLTGLLGSPRSFFTHLRGQAGLRTPFLFLLFSALFHTGACMTYVAESRVLMAGILLLNALVMPMASVGGGFLVVRMFLGRGISFGTLYAVYAYASGVTLLASWIPLFAWITEPWKWILIGLGLVRFAGLTRARALLVLAGSLLITALFFGSLAPALQAIRGG